MSNIFQGLESMGIKDAGSLKIYEEEKSQDTKHGDSDKPAEPVYVESDFLFEKKFQCPVCDREFKAKTVKVGKPRLIASDSDLRPKYAGIDSIKYDAIVCPNCGYAALSRFFSYMTSAQTKLIRENVTANFTGIPDNGDIYTYDDAIKRHKLVLYNTIVKGGKNSEKAYVCLKMAWLYRGMKENVPDSIQDKEEYKKNCDNLELEMINNAYEGFMVSRTKENFPICGMDTTTFDYLLSDLAFRIGRYDIADKLSAGIIISRTANTRVKEKARTLRENIKAKTAK